MKDTHIHAHGVLLLAGLLLVGAPFALHATIAWSAKPLPASAPHPLVIENGWYVDQGRVVWGFGQHNGWWRPGQRANITRNAPGVIGPNRTEDLDKLTDAMLRFGYPAFEHNFGLWYDRRRDRHDTGRRANAHVVPPFLEQPWARGDQGVAWDGLPKYDLTRFNAWYFQRLKDFAALCDRKGTILLLNDYMQHALLEQQAHYADFPWRPVNCIQKTGMPDSIPAAKAFYDVSDPIRRKLHRLYIRKCLDELGDNSHVVHLCSQEYTGPLEFMRFWLDTIFQWEDETGKDVHVGLGATKDVLDAVLNDRQRAARISTIDLRYWWYKPDGSMFAPRGGHDLPGRYFGAFAAREGSPKLVGIHMQVARYAKQGMGTVAPATPKQIHRQVLEYRTKYPDKAIIHQIPATRQGIWALLTAGGSLMVGQMPYPNLADPKAYIAPEQCKLVQPTYAFIRKYLAGALPKMRPGDVVLDHKDRNWCLIDPGKMYLVYAMKGGRFRLDLSDDSGSYRAQWFDPRGGQLNDATNKLIRGGKPVTINAPDDRDWVLWLHPDTVPRE